MPQAHFTLQQAPVPPSSSLCRLPLLQCSCSHPFPSVSPFLLLLNVFVQIWNRDEGHFVQSLFLWETECWSLSSPQTLHLLDLPVLHHLVLGLDKLTIRVFQPQLNLVLSTSVFFFILLPSAYLPFDPSLPISVSPLLSLCFSLSEVLNLREPEDPLQPLGPWVNAGPTNTPFCTLSYKDKDATPSHKEEPLSWSTLLKEDLCNEQQLNTFNTCT